MDLSKEYNIKLHFNLYLEFFLHLLGSTFQLMNMRKMQFINAELATAVNKLR